jgi:hypothetical protein
MADTVVDLGDGSPELTSMNEFMFGRKFPGPVYEEGQPPPAKETLYLNRGYIEEISGPDRVDIYEMTGSTLAEPLTSYENPATALRVMQEQTREGDTELKRKRLFNRRLDSRIRDAGKIARETGEEPTLEDIFDFAGPQIALEEGGIVDLPMDFGTMEGEVDDFDMLTLGKTTPPEPADRGIGGLLMYEDLADPQYPLRPIQSQNFGKKRGFQYGQMVQLNDRDDAVGGKLLKQAGIQAPASEVLATLDPKVVDQMSRVLGRDIG